MSVSLRKANKEIKKQGNLLKSVIGLKATASQEMDARSFLHLSNGEDSDKAQCPSVSHENELPSPTFTQQEFYYSEREPAKDSQNIWYENTLIPNEELFKRPFRDFQKQETEIAEVKAAVLNYAAIRVETEELKVKDLLAKGEAIQETFINEENSGDVHTNSSDSDGEDWEEVSESNPRQGLQLNMEFPKTCKRTKKVDDEMRLKRKLNKERKENQVYLHKMNLQVCLKYGNDINRVINDHEILGTVLSLIPIQLCSFEVINIEFLEKILAWYKKEYSLKQNDEEKYQPNEISLKFKLLEQIRSKIVTENLYFILIFISILRSMGWECRLMFNLVTLPIKPLISSLSTTNQQTDEKSEECIQNLRVDENDNKISNQVKNDNILQLDGNNDVDCACVTIPIPTKNKKSETSETNAKLATLNNKTRKNKERSPKITKVVANKTAIPILSCEDANVSGKLNYFQNTPNILITDEQNLSHESDEMPKKIKRTTRKRSETVNPLIKNENTTQSIIVKGKVPRSISAPGYTEKSSKCLENINKNDTKLRKPRYKENRQAKVSPKSTRQRKIQDGSDPGDSSFRKDVWCEIYVNELEQWVPVDVYDAKVNCAKDIYNRATHPVCYIVGWDNNNNVKDLTCRYVPVRVWNTMTRKQRVDAEWWEETLRPWVGPKTDRDKKEDEELKNIQLEAPLPTSIAEFKNHPLYVLKRHILKYQALYPAEPPILGYVRGEAVYPRDCVYTLGSRETWLKEAKMVRPGEEAYKIVNAKPKFDRLSKKYVIRPLEIFGPWQVEEYVPPAAQNGLVPRNAYGNVELFKPCMLPEGTVHLKLSCLNKLARKLNIDCAPAMTGYDFNRGFTHPIFDGYVVCKEFQDVITKAWFKEQEDQDHRARKKFENRVYGNWKRLIKGLLICQRAPQLQVRIRI